MGNLPRPPPPRKALAMPQTYLVKTTLLARARQASRVVRDGSI